MPDRPGMVRLSGDAAPTPEASLRRRENATRLRDAVQQLPPDYGLILVLHDMEDLSDEDIAEITGLRPGTIRVRLHRARLLVRKELARAGREGTRSKPEKQLLGRTHANEIASKFAEVRAKADPFREPGVIFPQHTRVVASF
jgi:RNA polymerase sigma-70 factor (ECF subfamily)